MTPWKRNLAIVALVLFVAFYPVAAANAVNAAGNGLVWLGGQVSKFINQVT